MGFIQNYLCNRELKRFNKQEEMRITKEKIKIQNDLRIERIKEYRIKSDIQEKCRHYYKVINSGKRYIHYPFKLSKEYYEYDLICTKCDKEQISVSEEYKDYLINKSKVIND